MAFLSKFSTTADDDDYKKFVNDGEISVGNSKYDSCFGNFYNCDPVVDFALCSVHGDMQSHTGVIMTLDHGADYESSTRQKTIPRVQQRQRFVGFNDYMGQILCAHCF